MWTEMRSAVFHRKVPIYGPYLHFFIQKTWEKLFPGEDFHAPNWIHHEPIRLRQKYKWANTITRAEAEAARMEVDEDEIAEEEEDEDSQEEYEPTSAGSSWVKKLKDRMKTLFCMQAKGQYQTHVA
jgi:hypothetical protein